MWCLKIFLVALLYVGFAMGEAPYAAAGWRPQRPFNLPADYLPPSRGVEKQQQPTYVLEINKERVDYAGQIQNSILNSANRQPANPYFPPRKQNTDFLKVQRPPYQEPGPQFVLKSAFPRSQQPQKTQIFQISETQSRQQRGERLPTQQPFFAFEGEQRSAVSKPAQNYGPPSSGQEQNFAVNYPDSRNLEPQVPDGEVDEGVRIAIEALNVARESYNRQQEGEVINGSDGTLEADVQEVDDADAKRPSDGYPSSRATRGQYYVLGPDNRLQLVRFSTTQSEEEARNNSGFTAQLRYTPVGEINDPVFKYNGQGQLVRIVKK
ncbi:PREDICTED: uncharacterized protein LOC108360615 [Rhagoletis zephyria]|uniref:uncharacterized protein LOC108360615 n=1 Tax=Rhagoletis zephyria TaxID=28612 RepID=UPI00081194C0|nr:PREDICTED: uncharacterized protein LOC108360615 [Rhagoletis zephyria]